MFSSLKNASFINERQYRKTIDRRSAERRPDPFKQRSINPSRQRSRTTKQYQKAKANRKSTADRKSPNSTRRDSGRVRSVSEMRYERLGEWFNPSLNYIKYVLGIIGSIIFSGKKYRVFDGRGHLLTHANGQRSERLGFQIATFPASRSK